MILCHCEFLNNSTIPIATFQCLLVFVISFLTYLTWSFHPDLGPLVVFLSVSHVAGCKPERNLDAYGLDEQRECGSVLSAQSFVFAHVTRNTLGSGVLYSIKAVLPEEKRVLYDWTLAKCFKRFLLCGTVQGSQTLFWRRQMGQMTPPRSFGVLFHMDARVHQPQGQLWSSACFCFQFSLHHKTLQHPIGCWPCCFGSTPSHLFRPYSYTRWLYLKFIYHNNFEWIETASMWQLLGKHDDFQYSHPWYSCVEISLS